MSVLKVYGTDAEKLKDKTVMIVGAGGLGCTVANLLARMKVKLILIDNDMVDDTNLERQTLFDVKDLLKPKVEVAKEKLSQFTDITAIYEELTKENIDYLENADLIMDCTDNVETRLIINEYCHKNNVPWIYSGAVSNIGIIYFVNNDRACYECINLDKKGDTSCEIGVLNTVVTTVASIAVHVAVDFLVKGKIEPDIIRISNSNITRLKAKKHLECRVCGGKNV